MQNSCCSFVGFHANTILHNDYRIMKFQQFHLQASYNCKCLGQHALWYIILYRSFYLPWICLTIKYYLAWWKCTFARKFLQRRGLLNITHVNIGHCLGPNVIFNGCPPWCPHTLWLLPWTISCGIEDSSFGKHTAFKCQSSLEENEGCVRICDSCDANTQCIFTAEWQRWLLWVLSHSLWQTLDRSTRNWNPHTHYQVKGTSPNVLLLGKIYKHWNIQYCKEDN